MPTGYSLPHDTPINKQVKHNSTIISNVSATTVFHRLIVPLNVCKCFMCLRSNSFIILSKKVKYKEAYEMVKAKAYTLHPEGVNFVNTRKANKIINEVGYSPAD